MWRVSNLRYSSGNWFLIVSYFFTEVCYLFLLSMCEWRMGSFCFQTGSFCSRMDSFCFQTRSFCSRMGSFFSQMRSFYSPMDSFYFQMRSFYSRKGSYYFWEHFSFLDKGIGLKYNALCVSVNTTLSFL